MMLKPSLHYQRKTYIYILMKKVFNIALLISTSSAVDSTLNLIVLNDLHLDPDYKLNIPGPTKLVRTPLSDLTPLTKEAILLFMEDFVPSQQTIAQKYEEIMAKNGSYSEFE